MGTRPILDAYDRPKMLSLARRTFVSKSSTTFARSLSVSAARYAGGKVTVIQGEGAKAGTVPSDIEQATGLERMELLGKMQGEDPFRMEPLEVPRIVGCTGFPVDSHDTLWSNIHKDKDWRCPECGCCYSIDFQGDEHAAHH